jgi:hypothetical protein
MAHWRPSPTRGWKVSSFGKIGRSGLPWLVYMIYGGRWWRFIKNKLACRAWSWSGVWRRLKNTYTVSARDFLCRVHGSLSRLPVVLIACIKVSKQSFRYWWFSAPFCDDTISSASERDTISCGQPFTNNSQSWSAILVFYEEDIMLTTAFKDLNPLALRPWRVGYERVSIHCNLVYPFKDETKFIHSLSLP